MDLPLSISIFLLSILSIFYLILFLSLSFILRPTFFPLSPYNIPPPSAFSTTIFPPKHTELFSISMDSPIEALLFENLTVVNNPWTWIALATAAVSFWWIRASSFSSASATISISLQSRPISSINSPEDCICSRSNNNNNSSPDVLPAAIPILSSPAAPSIFKNEDRFTKGKFIVYFEDDNSDNIIGEVESESGVSVAGEWPESFEWVVERMRMGDLGWYRYQDLTAINGNVVRLWDGVSV